MVRRGFHGRLHPPQLDEEPGAAPRRLRRPPRHRHLQHLVGTDAVQRPLPRHCRARQARRLGAWRLPGGVSGHLARRDHAPPHRHALSQPGQHGRRREPARQPHRRGGSAGRLRQDDAGAAHGCGQLRPAGPRRLRRPHAQRQVPRPGHRVRDPRLALQRRRQGRQIVPCGLHGRRGRHEPLGRALHDHGHGFDHGQHGRGPGNGAAGERRHPGRGLAAGRAGAPGRAAHRRDGV